MNFVGNYELAMAVVAVVALPFLGWALCRKLYRHKCEERERVNWSAQQFSEYCRFMTQVMAVLKRSVPQVFDETSCRIFLKNDIIHFYDPHFDRWREARLHTETDASRLAQQVLGISPRPGPYHV